MQRGSVTSKKLSPNWDPVGNRFHCALRDAGYMMMDMPRGMLKLHSKYGLFMKFLKDRRKGKVVNPEDFKGIDVHEMRHMLQIFHFMKGPFQRIDIRIFNWMYVSLLVYSLVQFYILNENKKRLLDDCEVPLSERRKKYSDDYEEDVKPK